MRASLSGTLLLSLLLACGDKEDDTATNGTVGTNPTTTSGGTTTPGTTGGTTTGTSGSSGTTGTTTSTPDADGDGFDADDDCDDTDPSVNPGATEACDGVDNNCDGQIDEAGGSTWYADADGDGFGDAGTTSEACEADEGWVADATDCDDGSAAVHPEAEETCDGADNDCDGDTDEEVLSTFYLDFDSDGYGDDAETVEACTPPSGYTEESGDCDDTDTAFHPGADESDCTDASDYNCDGSVGYSDDDGDGFAACEECDDSSADVHPGANEVCDDVDNNCDGDTDDDDDELDRSTTSTWYNDWDGDGYGDSSSTTQACDQPSGYVVNDDDCDDTEPLISPGATEVCDEVDNDCDGRIDDDDVGLDTSTASTWYDDADGDGYGDPLYTQLACDQPLGAVSNSEDCDDSDSGTSPAASEICDEIDNDCDGSIDDDDSSVSASSQSQWYMDADGDTYGDPANAESACDQPAGYVASNEDCDDDDASISPDATETCDEVDNNCDGRTDDDDPALSLTSTYTWYNDWDGDGYGDSSSTAQACEEPSGYVSNDDDCDDTEPLISPGATETCDGADNDCDGRVDDDDVGVDTSTGDWFYADDDGDGYGDSSNTTQACDVPSGYVVNDDDCDDTDSAVSPDTPEICNGSDDDCDGLVDSDDTDVDPSSGDTWYADDDGDGYGDERDSQTSCDQPTGYVEDDSDCDDNDSAINPDGSEVCDGSDNDCDGLTDSEDGDVDTTAGSTYYIDADGDGFGTTDDTVDACDVPSGYAADSSDCDDTDATVNPDAEEVCDEQDNDCNGSVDDSATDGAWYADDADGDGFGSPDSSTWACEGPDNELDCDDTDEYEPQVVDSTADSSIATGTIDLPWASIGSALSNAFECVVVYPGTYYEVIDYDGDDISIVSTDGPESTIIDGSGYSSPVITFDDGEGSGAELSGFTITGGEGVVESSESTSNCYSDYTCYYYYYTYYGGGIYVDGATPTIDNLILVDNDLPLNSETSSGYSYYYYASYGGAVFVTNTILDLSDVHMEDNQAGEGGGLFVDSSAEVGLEQAYVGSNSATDGGGAFVDGGALSLTNVLFAWNEADDSGGGILASDATLDLSNVTHGKDDATSGGGIYLEGTCTADVHNTIIFESNSAEGIYASSSTTFSGQYNNVYGNAGGEYNGISDPTGTDGNISAEPRFELVTDDGDPDNDSWALRSSSPSVDAGDTGLLDPDGTTSDMGAYGGPGADWDRP